ncbi:MAG: branched-chain amino acid ABC transporter permease [Rhodobiaceae bacterium]|nr:branched-chain amino acid ABC transporter permease [Rhodobiaceae bacterium]
MATRGQTIFLILLFVALALVPLAGERYPLELAVQLMIFGLFAMSLNVLIGHVGSISFGHAAFFAIGGYACAYFQTRLGWPIFVSMPAAIGLTAVCALIIGYFCVRLTELYFAILTLAFSMLVWAVAFKWTEVTGGGDGFVGITAPDFMSNPVLFFWFTFAIVAVSVGLLWLLSNSTMGKTFIAIRENPTRADFLGVNVRRMRLIAFVIAGAFAGIAGALLSFYVRGMFPESAFWTQSGQVMIMVLLGGMHSFVGPILGAVVIYVLETFISQYTQYWPIVLGTILLLIVMFAPDGLIGIFRSIGRRMSMRGRRNA